MRLGHYCSDDWLAGIDNQIQLLHGLELRGGIFTDYSREPGLWDAIYEETISQNQLFSFREYKGNNINSLKYDITFFICMIDSESYTEYKTSILDLYVKGNYKILFQQQDEPEKNKYSGSALMGAWLYPCGYTRNLEFVEKTLMPLFQG